MRLQESNQTAVGGARTKRIAYNSLSLFVRFAVIMVLNLYSTRFILGGLGEEDYGIYSAVASVVLIGSCLSPVLLLSFQRYYSFSLGEQDTDKYSAVYTVSIRIVAILALAVLVVMELVGLFFLDQMTIPVDRLDVAKAVFQFSLFTFVFSLVQIPFLAAIISHEDMGIYTVISMTECLLKFALAYCIVRSGMDGMIFYGAGLLCISFLLFLAYLATARWRYAECRYRSKSVQRGLYRELLSFSGWTLYGTLAGTGLIQGSAILLNLYFGPVANAAFDIALRIYNAFTQLTNAIVVAFRPAMIKSYAEKNMNYLRRLFSLSNVCIMLLLIVTAIPLVYFMPDVLRLWLKDYPEAATQCSRLMLVFVVILAMHNPITTIVQATGQIRSYSLLVETITILNVPVAWFCFEVLHAPIYALFLVMLTLASVAHAMRVYCLRGMYVDFSLSRYLATIVLPVAMAMTLCTLYSLGLIG